jgi:hypothetical protein
VQLKKRAEEHGDIQLPQWALDEESAPQRAPTKEDARPAKYRPKKKKKKK